MPTPEPHVIRRGSGVPILIVHGNGVDHRSLLGIEPAFQDAPAYERLYIDLPGFGGTAALKGQGGLVHYAQWLDRAVTELIGTTPFAVIGSSLGGLLARDIAANRPRQCRAMALLAPVVSPNRANRTLPNAVVFEQDHALLDSLSEFEREAFTAMTVVQNRANWERYRRYIIPGIQSVDSAASDRLDVSYALPTMPEERTHHFRGETLIITGRQDAVVGFTDQWELAMRYEHASYSLLDRTGHNVQIERPDVVNALLHHWLLTNPLVQR